jgi:putative hemolysin
MPDLSSCRIGNVYLKIASNDTEIKKAQILRHFVFFEEVNGATEPSGKIDEDEFDKYFEHLLVIDDTDKNNEKVVGTYRLLRRTPDKKVEKFYTETEYDISKLKAGDFNLLELGRSCIHPAYRDGKVIQLLWKGIGIFIAHHKINYLFGCGSFQDVDANKHSLGLSYLYHYHSADSSIAPTARKEVKANFDLIPIEKLDKKLGFSSLPPLLKGYIRTGCKIGEGAVLDKFCNTTDVCIILDTASIAKRYSEHFVKSE